MVYNNFSASGSIRVKNSDAAYIRFGVGDKLLFAFHGFGFASEIFLPIAEALHSTYTAYAFDLPFHGKTKWREEKMDGNDFIDLIEQVCAMEKKTVFELMGYSFGARIVQTIFLSMPRRVEKIWLIAPDGIATKWTGALFRVPKFFRRIAMRALKNPAWFLYSLYFLHQKRWIEPYIYLFFQRRLNNKQARDALFYYWLSGDALGVNPEVFKAALKKTGTRTELFFGKNDPLIPVSAGQWLQKALPNVTLHILLEGGHHALNERLNKLLKQLV